jgi:NAD dependent epimerase/dehydratase family enzyme
MGFAGILGSGKQYMSWITLEDLVGVILHAIDSPDLHGPVNAVAPAPVTNEEFTRAVAEALWGSPAPPVFTIPGFVVRLAFGEMGKELLLASTRVEPGKLKNSGYVFLYPELEAALQHLVGRASLTKTR